MPFGLNVTGLEEAKKSLADLDKKIQRSILRKGLRAGCKVLLKTARLFAPVKSGALERNIKIRSGGAKKGVARFSVGVGKKDFTGKAWYAGPVIYGHYAGSRKLGDRRKFIKGNNFLERAFDTDAGNAANEIALTWVRLVEAEGKK